MTAFIESKGEHDYFAPIENFLINAAIATGIALTITSVALVAASIFGFGGVIVGVVTTVSKASLILAGLACTAAFGILTATFLEFASSFSRNM